jgi:uncharacterized membrane protein YkvA (DUF1232 family)
MILQALLGVVIALGLIWLVFVIVLAIVHPEVDVLREGVRILPDTVRLIRRLAADPSLPRGIRVRLWLLLAYLVSPVDLVPDFVPVLGFADDAIIVSLVLRSVVRRAGPAAVEQHWPGTDAGLATLTRLCRLPST